MHSSSSVLWVAILILICFSGNWSQGASIFDKHLVEHPTSGRKSPLDAIEHDKSKRHIHTLRVLNSEEKDEFARKMEEKTQKFNDDSSNERNIWRSHPQKPDFEGPDTASVAGLDF